MEGNVKYQFNVRLHGDKGALVNNTFRARPLEPGIEGWAEFPTTLPDTPEVTHHPFPGEIDDLVDEHRVDPGAGDDLDYSAVLARILEKRSRS